MDIPRPLYRFEKGRYTRVGIRKAISLRPYKPRLREDKTVQPRDLRLEQMSYFVDKMKRIGEKWREAKQQKGLSDFTQSLCSQYRLRFGFMAWFRSEVFSHTFLISTYAHTVDALLLLYQTRSGKNLIAVCDGPVENSKTIRSEQNA